MAQKVPRNKMQLSFCLCLVPEVLIQVSVWFKALMVLIIARNTLMFCYYTLVVFQNHQTLGRDLKGWDTR